ncbi:MAG TPA: putative Ig domain-containing protein [Woeseiaceae bacterium]|nr:putative Ig domain-containing protein [Woeseiaceae bacterium]
MAAVLTGCLGSEAPPGGGGLAAGTDGGNTAPQISGSPQRVAVMSDSYLFRPSASDADGDALTFSIRNKPAWASFDAATGRLEGVPQFGDTGTYEGIEVSVSDGAATASLPRFSIAVSRDALGAVTLEWLPPQSNTDGSYASDLAGYVIYWGTEPGAYDQQVRIDTVGLTAYVVDSLRPATYYFTATAFNAAGIESDFSNEVMRSVVIN